jgi:two-component system chemotaxis response regulator CheB
MLPHRGLGPESPVVDRAVVGIAAGGAGTLGTVLAALPTDFAAAVVVVLDRRSPPALPTRMHVRQAEAGDVLAAGTVFVAPPDHQVLVNADGTLSLSHSRRPSADLLLESLAKSYRKRAVAVVLAGNHPDGSQGVQAVRRMGGTVLVQEPRSTTSPTKPWAAIATGCVHEILPVGEIGPALVRLTALPFHPGRLGD